VSETTNLPIALVEVGPRYRQGVGDLAELQSSIQAVGLLHPIVVDRDMRLLAGARRLAAYAALGWERIPARIIDADALLVEAHENIVREDFRPSEAVRIADALAAREGEAAHQRMVAGKACVDSTGGETRVRVARAVGTSWQRLERAREIVRAAERDPYLRPLVEEMDATRNVAGAYKKLQAALTKYPQGVRGNPNGDHGSRTRLTFSFCPNCGSEGHRPVKVALTVTGGARDGLMLSHCLDDTELERLATFLRDASVNRSSEAFNPVLADEGGA
jgi:ParB family chromosome partitioning protein